MAKQRAQLKDNILPIFWEERGPTNVGGRTRGIVIDANDPTRSDRLGRRRCRCGLWKTTNIDAGSPTWNNYDDLIGKPGHLYYSSGS